jgi:thiol:disulfide interchange protein DsbA
MAKKDNQVLMTRNLIIGFICVVAILILGFGSYLSSGIQDRGEASAGSDYTVLEDARPPRPGSPIAVVEFFSYRCAACRNFEPLLEDWVEDLPDDVEFSRQHVVFSPIDELFAKTHLAIQGTDNFEDNHSRIFTAIHGQGRQFLTPDMVGDFLDGRGMDKTEFIRSFNSPAIKRLSQRAQSEQRRFGIAGTPTLIIAGKYRVEMNNGQRRALVVAGQLIEKERASEAPSS